MNQKGAVPLLLLLAAIAVLGFLVFFSYAPLREGILNTLFPKPASNAAVTPWDGVPDLPINYSQDVWTWWYNHPFNSSSPNYRPDINSPSNQFNVQTQYSGNMQAAVDAAHAAGGGTVYFPAGTYSGTFNLIDKNNIHFIGEGTVIINLTATITVAGCQTSVTYADISAQVAAGNPQALECVTTGRNTNIYFKNLTFDGGNTLLQAMAVSATKNMVYDNVIFRNFVDPGTHHRGLVSGNAVLDNIWFRNSQFLGKERYALYLDGLHGGGVINSTVNGQFGSGGFLFLTNDDLSRDHNQNGTLEPSEKRTADHVVVANNTFASPIYNGVTATGKDILVAGNTFQFGMNAVADFDAKSSDINSNLTYEYFGNMVINNTTQNVKYLMEISASPVCNKVTNCSKQGRYKIMGNRVQNASSFIDNALIGNTAHGTVEGPNEVSGNCINNPSCTPVGPALPSSQPTPTPTSTPAASSPPQVNFPIGVFEDGNMIWGDSVKFNAMIDDLKSKGLDSVMFVNNNVDRDDAMLSSSDQKNFNVYVSANHQTNPYFNDTTPTLAEARNIIYPVVDKYKLHSSVKGYNIADEPTVDKQTHIVNLVQAYKERDGGKPASPVFIGINRGDVIYQASQPNAFFMDAYPFSVQSAACDFTMKGFGYTDRNMSQYIRQMTASKPADQPLYIILQTHNVGDASWGINQLRVPSIPEVKGQFWTAIGEGVDGIFWFIYHSQQGWTGLKDAPNLMAEVSSLTNRVNPLKTTLLDTNRNSTDLFTANNGAYVSTLTSKDGTKKYAVVANIGNCSANQNITVSSASLSGQLRDLESGQSYSLGQAISFAPGDGKIFELVASPSTQNILTNGSFDTASGWSLGAGSSIDTTVSHSSGSSLKITGPADIYTRQTPALLPNKTYSFSYWVKTENITGTGAGFRYVQLAPSVITLVQKPHVSGTSDWQQITGTFTTPANFEHGRLDLLYKLNAGDVAWFDDVILCEGANCLTPATPTPGPSAAKIGDLDGNNKVDIFDYNILLTDFGKTGPGIQGDIDNNGKVDIFDYNLLLTNFGK